MCGVKRKDKKMMLKEFRPKRPTSLSLENICRPDFGSQSLNQQGFDLRQTKSFSTDIIHRNIVVKGIPFGSNYRLDSSAQQTSPSRDRYSEESLENAVHTFSESGDSWSVSEASFDHVNDVTPPQMVDASVATANGKIGPRISRKPKQFPKIKFKSPTEIDFSFGKGLKKDSTSVDHSMSKTSVLKKTTCEDFSLNKSISNKPTKNDYTFGDHRVKPSTRKDYSTNKNIEPKPSTKYNYNYAPNRQKPTTRYDYRTNWQKSLPPTRYNYTYYRGYKLINTTYDYAYNKVNSLSQYHKKKYILNKNKTQK